MTGTGLWSSLRFFGIGGGGTFVAPVAGLALADGGVGLAAAVVPTGGAGVAVLVAPGFGGGAADFVVAAKLAGVGLVIVVTTALAAVGAVVPAEVVTFVVLVVVVDTVALGATAPGRETAAVFPAGGATRVGVGELGASGAVVVVFNSTALTGRLSGFAAVALATEEDPGSAVVVPVVETAAADPLVVSAREDAAAAGGSVGSGAPAWGEASSEGVESVVMVGSL